MPHNQISAEVQLTKSQGNLRIIGGVWRRSVLRFPAVEGLRPTPDRVRETVFNWLGQDLSGRSSLELFAGSGAFSFESLSRGAAHAVCVDLNPSVIRAIQDNAVRLRASKLELRRADAVAFLASDRATYDVIFVDPPYREEWASRLWPLLHKRLNDLGFLYFEAAEPLPPGNGWETWRQDRAGKVHYHLFRKLTARKEIDAESRLSGNV